MRLPSQFLIFVGLITLISCDRKGSQPSAPSTTIQPKDNAVSASQQTLSGDFVEKCEFYAIGTDAPPMVTKVGTISARARENKKGDGAFELFFNGKETRISADRINVLAYGKLKGNTFLVTSTTPDVGNSYEPTPEIVILSYDVSGVPKRATLNENSGQKGLGNNGPFGVLSALSDDSTHVSLTPDGSSVLFDCGKAGNLVYDGLALRFSATGAFKNEKSKKAKEANDVIHATDLHVLASLSLSKLFQNKRFLEQFRVVAGDQIAREAKAKISANSMPWMENEPKKGADHILATGWAKYTDWNLAVSTRYDATGIQGFIIDKEHHRLNVFGVANANLLNDDLKKELKELQERN